MPLVVYINDIYIVDGEICFIAARAGGAIIIATVVQAG